MIKVRCGCGRKVVVRVSDGESVTPMCLACYTKWKKKRYGGYDNT